MNFKNTVYLITFIAFCLFNSSTKVAAQSYTKQNTVYLEFLGNGIIGSINYERQLLKKIRLDLRIGAGFYKIYPSHLTIPLGINYLLKLNKSNSFLDFGLGATYTKTDVTFYAIVDHHPGFKQTNYWNFIPSIGYRKQTKGNLMYRFSLTPVWNSNGFFPYFGCSFGKSF